MSAPPSLIGTTLDTYRIHSLHGSGSMAAIYPGFYLRLHRTVVVRVLSTTPAADAANFARFRQEAWRSLSDAQARSAVDCGCGPRSTKSIGIVGMFLER